MGSQPQSESTAFHLQLLDQGVQNLRIRRANCEKVRRAKGEEESVERVRGGRLQD